MGKLTTVVANRNYWGSDYSLTSYIGGGSFSYLPIYPMPDPIPGYSKMLLADNTAESPDTNTNSSVERTLSAYELKRLELTDLAKSGALSSFTPQTSGRELRIPVANPDGLSDKEVRNLIVFENMLRFRFDYEDAELQAIDLLSTIVLDNTNRQQLLEQLIYRSLHSELDKNKVWEYFDELKKLDLNAEDLEGIKTMIELDLQSVDQSYPALEEGLLLQSNISTSPNPFNPTTTFTVVLNQKANVELKVFDMVGRSVATLINVELLHLVDSELRYIAVSTTGVQLWVKNQSARDTARNSNSMLFNAAINARTSESLPMI